jgi:hypothetical protein
MYARPWPSSLHRQCSRVRFALWNVGYRTWRKSYSHFDLEIFGFPQPYHWVKRRTNDDRLPLSLWEVWFCSSLGVPIPVLIGPPQQCACNVFHYDSYGDHLQTCQTKSADSQVHDWVAYKLGALLGSVGHRVNIHKITPATGKERGDLEIKD